MWTVRQRGWSGSKNGELLRKAEAAGFEVFLTGDQSIGFQQNLSGMQVRILVMKAASNALEDLLPLGPAVLEAMPLAQAGAWTVIQGA